MIFYFYVSICCIFNFTDTNSIFITSACPRIWVLVHTSHAHKDRLSNYKYNVYEVISSVIHFETDECDRNYTFSFPAPYHLTCNFDWMKKHSMFLDWKTMFTTHCTEIAFISISIKIKREYKEYNMELRNIPSKILQHAGYDVEGFSHSHTFL